MVTYACSKTSDVAIAIIIYESHTVWLRPSVSLSVPLWTDHAGRTPNLRGPPFNIYHGLTVRVTHTDRAPLSCWCLPDELTGLR